MPKLNKFKWKFKSVAKLTETSLKAYKICKHNWSGCSKTNQMLMQMAQIHKEKKLFMIKKKNSCLKHLLKIMTKLTLKRRKLLYQSKK